MKPRIPYTRPSITSLELEFAADAAANGWGEHYYDYIIRFEEALKAHLGVKYDIATSSRTGALHMGLHALGIGPGDQMIMADTNWINVAAPITVPPQRIASQFDDVFVAFGQRAARRSREVWQGQGIEFGVGLQSPHESPVFVAQCAHHLAAGVAGGPGDNRCAGRSCELWSR